MTTERVDAAEAIPTPDDWGTVEERATWGVDEEHAFTHFGGRSLVEAEAFFDSDFSMGPLMALYFVPSRPFGFYVQALIRYLRSEAAQGDAQAVSVFLSVLNLRSTQEPDALRAIWPEIEPAVTHVVEHSEFYEPAWEIEGDFRTKARVIAESGFPVSFSIEFSELVPCEVTPERAASYAPRALPWLIAVQVWRNAGLHDLPTDPTKDDIVRIFGPPDAAKVDDPALAWMNDWVRYEYPTHHVHISFQGDGQVATVLFCKDEQELFRKTHQSRLWVHGHGDPSDQGAGS